MKELAELLIEEEQLQAQFELIARIYTQNLQKDLPGQPSDMQKVFEYPNQAATFQLICAEPPEELELLECEAIEHDCVVLPRENLRVVGFESRVTNLDNEAGWPDFVIVECASRALEMHPPCELQLVASAGAKAQSTLPVNLSYKSALSRFAKNDALPVLPATALLGGKLLGSDLLSYDAVSATITEYFKHRSDLYTFYDNDDKRDFEAQLPCYLSDEILEAIIENKESQSHEREFALSPTQCAGFEDFRHRLAGIRIDLEGTHQSAEQVAKSRGLTEQRKRREAADSHTNSVESSTQVSAQAGEKKKPRKPRNEEEEAPADGERKRRKLRKPAGDERSPDDAGERRNQLSTPSGHNRQNQQETERHPETHNIKAAETTASARQGERSARQPIVQPANNQQVKADTAQDGSPKPAGEQGANEEAQAPAPANQPAVVAQVQQPPEQKLSLREMMQMRMKEQQQNENQAENNLKLEDCIFNEEKLQKLKGQTNSSVNVEQLLESLKQIKAPANEYLSETAPQYARVYYITHKQHFTKNLEGIQECYKYLEIVIQCAAFEDYKAGSVAARMAAAKWYLLKMPKIEWWQTYNQKLLATAESEVLAILIDMLDNAETKLYIKNILGSE